MKRYAFLILLGFVATTWLGCERENLSYTETKEPVASEVQASPAEHDSTQSVTRPVIGIASLSSESYVRAVRELGGIPVVFPNANCTSEEIEVYLQLVDGLVMPGGADIPPSEYGEKPHSTTKVLSDNRFHFEKELISAWIERTDKPLLGICLGSQWLNVAHGGSLVQDIPSEFGVNHRGTTHSVSLEPDSRLGRIFGATNFEVNSYHHQAVRKVGDGLRVVARSADGIVEATETTDPDRFLIGVQWHPEQMIGKHELQAKLFKAFIDASLKRKKSSSVEPAESNSPQRELISSR